MRKVITQTVVHGVAIDTVRVVGTLAGEDEVVVYPKLAERVTSLRVHEGEQVRKGKILAILAADIQSRSVKQAQAALVATETSRDALAVEVERVRALVKAGASAPSQLTNLENQLRTSHAQVAQMEAGLAIAAAQHNQAIITAPIDGVVANLGARQGDMLGPNAPLCTLVSNARLKAVLRVPEREFLQIQLGMPAQVVLLGDPAVTVPGHVSLRGAMIDSRSRSGRIEVALDEVADTLLAGASVKVSIELKRSEQTLLVPTAAIILDEASQSSGFAQAFIVDKGRAHIRRIKIGQQQHSSIAVLEGLHVGEQLVIRGQNLLRDGDAVALVSHVADTEHNKSTSDNVAQ